MATNAIKTVEYAFDTNTGTLATDTALGTSTRYEFPYIGITIPETTSRTFKSVILETNWRDAYSTVRNVVGWRLGISTGSNAYSDLDILPTAQANTGDHEAGIVIRDVTDYFNLNFGEGAFNKCVVAYAQATAAAATVQNITAKLYITYEYEASASRSIKTVRLPIQSASALLGVQRVEIGVGGTNGAPANQIPALDTFLPETNKNYKSEWIEIFANDGSSSTPTFSASFVLNDTLLAPRAILAQALNTGCYYYDILLAQYTSSSGVETSTYTISGSQATAFKIASSLVSRFDAIGGLFCVTYEYDSTSASVMNSVILPLDSTRILGSTSASADSITMDFWAIEPNVVLKQSGVLFYAQSAGASTLNVLAGGQTARPYTLTALVNSGGHALIHRVDHNSGFAFGRGKNTLSLKSYTAAAGTVKDFVGLVYLNYTSATVTGGENLHNHTTIWYNTSYNVSGAATSEYSISYVAQRNPAILPSDYYLNGVGFELGSRFGTAIQSIILDAQKTTGEYSGSGWLLLDTWTHTNDGELATYNQITSAIDKFNIDSNHFGKLNIQTNHSYHIWYLNVAALCWMRTYITHHSNTFLVSGSFVNPAGDGSNVVIDAYRITDNYWAGSALSTTSGSYAITVFDNVYPYYATASQDGTHIGRSASAIAV